MKKTEKALYIKKKLNELYPNPKAPLNHSNAFTLLIAVLLSAQTTDKRVNIVTQELFKKASTPEKMLKLGEKKVYEHIIKSRKHPPDTKGFAVWALEGVSFAFPNPHPEYTKQASYRK